MNWTSQVPVFGWLAMGVWLIFGMTVGSLTWLDVNAERDALDRLAISTATRTASLVEAQIDDFLLVGDVDAIRDLAKSLKANDPALSFRVTDADGRVLVDEGATKFAGITVPGTASPEAPMIADAGSVTVAMSPIEVAGIVHGTLTVSFDRSAVDRDLSSLVRARIVTAVVVGSLGLLGALAFSFWLMRPVNRVVTEMSNPSQTELKPISRGGPQDSSRLVDAFNYMRDRISRERAETEAQIEAWGDGMKMSTDQLAVPLGLASRYSSSIRNARSSTVVHKGLDDLDAIHGRLGELVTEIRDKSEPSHELRERLRRRT